MISIFMHDNCVIAVLEEYGMFYKSTVCVLADIFCTMRNNLLFSVFSEIR